ncbi:MAG: 2-C-methyl-D-erythritol 4-phosphate cytidylyltransferase [Acidimicrobiales bacterium]
MPGQAATWAVVVAGGSGSRFGGYKQFALLAGRPLVEWSCAAAQAACAGVVLVVPAPVLQAGAVDRYRDQGARVVVGGDSRAASVRAGLEALPDGVKVIVVHDAARPLSSPLLWEAVIGAVQEGADGAVPCLAVADTIKERQDDGRLVTLDRGRLLASQTPQAFAAPALTAAHAARREATDDAALVETMGGKVVHVKGEPTNLKITTHVDLVLAEALVAAGTVGHLLLPATPRPGAAR